MDMVAVGKRIKEARERGKLTQEELAEYVDMEEKKNPRSAYASGIVLAN